MMMQKHGIVTILGSESNRNCSQNGLSLSPMKKIDSFKELSHSKVTSELDIWSSILKHKNKDEASKIKTPPYIHPLVKKSKNCLTEKSLEICTENLGSETGSDGFFSYISSSEDNNSYDECLKENVKTCDNIENPKYYYSTKKSKCFPPPLPSLFSQSQHGQSQPLHMSPHRDNGRLFLSLQVGLVPSHNNFFTKRQNGRLILTFADDDEEEIVDEFDQDESVIEKTKMGSLELVVNKEIGLVSPKWSENFNKVTNFEDVKVVQQGSLPRSLPLINAYQYYWRTKTTRNVAPPIPNDTIFYQQNRINKVVVCGNMNIYQASNETPQQMLVSRGKNGDYLVHNLKCYKDSKK